MFDETLRAKLAGVWDLPDSQAARLHEHFELLTRWNRVLNLTSVRNLQDAVERHYCESVFLAAHLPDRPASIADLGSGGGFPGIPVAVLRPDCAVTLIESHQRKAVFLKEASRGLPNVRVLASRSEDVTETFDWIVSRAVRYVDMAPDLKRLTKAVQLLGGEEVPGEEFRWNAPIRLPWGQARSLWIGISRCFT